jgi:hypothetical protein
MDGYRIAPRMNSGKLDDVVVNDVELFRAEIMDSDTLWMCCYLQGTGVPNDRIVFWARANAAAWSSSLAKSPRVT